jgi:hypothetical protein
MPGSYQSHTIWHIYTSGWIFPQNIPAGYLRGYFEIDRDSISLDDARLYGDTIEFPAQSAEFKWFSASVNTLTQMSRFTADTTNTVTPIVNIPTTEPVMLHAPRCWQTSLPVSIAITPFTKVTWKATLWINNNISISWLANADLGHWDHSDATRLSYTSKTVCACWRVTPSFSSWLLQVSICRQGHMKRCSASSVIGCILYGQALISTTPY